MKQWNAFASLNNKRIGQVHNEWKMQLDFQAPGVCVCVAPLRPVQTMYIEESKVEITQMWPGVIKELSKTDVERPELSLQAEPDEVV